jgi:hypothetical protein
MRQQVSLLALAGLFYARVRKVSSYCSLLSLQVFLHTSAALLTRISRSLCMRPQVSLLSCRSLCIRLQVSLHALAGLFCMRPQVSLHT